jgi:transcription elongation factor
MLPIDAAPQTAIKRLAQAIAAGIIVVAGLSGCATPGPSGSHAPAATPAQPNYDSALSQAQSRVMALNNEIRSAEFNRPSPPIRTNGVADPAKQRAYEQSVVQHLRHLRALREEKTMWELRVNQLMVR